MKLCDNKLCRLHVPVEKVENPDKKYEWRFAEGFKGLVPSGEARRLDEFQNKHMLTCSVPHYCAPCEEVYHFGYEDAVQMITSKIRAKKLRYKERKDRSNKFLMAALAVGVGACVIAPRHTVVMHALLAASFGCLVASAWLNPNNDPKPDNDPKP